jgi:hypothetical protein
MAVGSPQIVINDLRPASSSRTSRACACTNGSGVEVVGRRKRLGKLKDG